MTTPNMPTSSSEPQEPRIVPVPGIDVRATISSAALLKGQPSVLIEHQGVIYALRATRAGKLILTK